MSDLEDKTTDPHTHPKVVALRLYMAVHPRPSEREYRDVIDRFEKLFEITRSAPHKDRNVSIEIGSIMETMSHDWLERAIAFFEMKDPEQALKAAMYREWFYDPLAARPGKASNQPNEKKKRVLQMMRIIKQNPYLPETTLKDAFDVLMVGAELGWEQPWHQQAARLQEEIMGSGYDMVREASRAGIANARTNLAKIMGWAPPDATLN